MGLKFDRERYPFSFTSRIEGEFTIHEMKNVEYKGRVYAHGLVHVKTKYDHRFIMHGQLHSLRNVYTADRIELDGVVVKNCIPAEVA